jgi:zinc-binding alcohol dehydrogenase/oxidoreductase
VEAEITMPRLFWGQMDLLGSTMGNVGEFGAVLHAMDEGLRPVVDTTYTLGEVEAALQRLDAAAQFGKVVLSVS